MISILSTKIHRFTNTKSRSTLFYKERQISEEGALEEQRDGGNG
jgi:hypothetical protein